MNEIRRSLDVGVWQRRENFYFGEPWAAQGTGDGGGPGSAGSEEESFFCWMKMLGIFCDNTRDAIKGSSVHMEERGFVSGRSGLEEDILRERGGLVREEDKGGHDGGDCLRQKHPSQIVTYVSSHDNLTSVG